MTSPLRRHPLEMPRWLGAAFSKSDWSSCRGGSGSWCVCDRLLYCNAESVLQDTGVRVGIFGFYVLSLYEIVKLMAYPLSSFIVVDSEQHNKTC